MPTFICPTEFQEADNLLTMTVYPNPVNNGEAHVVLSLDKSVNVRMEIINIEGKTIENKNLGEHSSKVTLPLQELAKGTYFIKLHQNDQIDLIKIIIK